MCLFALQIEEDAYQEDLGFSLGTMGKGKSGKVRGPPVDSKTKARISKTLQVLEMIFPWRSGCLSFFSLFLGGVCPFIFSFVCVQVDEGKNGGGMMGCVVVSVFFLCNNMYIYICIEFLTVYFNTILELFFVQVKTMYMKTYILSVT